MGRAEVAIRAGTLTSVRRIVPVVARARLGPDTVAAARVRLNAITGSPRPLRCVHRTSEEQASHRPAGGPPHPRTRPKADRDQATLFDLWRHHAFFITTDPAVADTVAADKTHRGGP
jgi:hypothetical protein